MRFCLDQFGERVFIDDAERGGTYFCPECGERMVQRRGEIMTHHFAHYPNTQCTDAWRYDESDWHSKYQSMFPKQNQEIVKELDGKKHRADVLYENRKIVIELQGDRLRQDEFEQRNKFFNTLGYKVIWLFDMSMVFKNGSIGYGPRKRSCEREWKRPSRVFSGFRPQEHLNDVEVWFQRSETDFDEQARFFQVLYSRYNLKDMECSFCHSLKELLRYLRDGKRTIDYSRLYDLKYGIRRTDGSDSIYYCPKTLSEAFVSLDSCSGCPFREELWRNGVPKGVGCTYRFEHMRWEFEGEVSSHSMREDGFIESVTVTNSEGEAQIISMDCPKTFLRSLLELWERYRPLKYIVAYNTKNNTTYSVFNPGWQKAKAGIIKGKIQNSRGFLIKGEEVVPNAEEPVWFVVDTVKTVDKVS